MAGTVALTGISGFLGGHVARVLVAQGWRVRALVRQPRNVPAQEGLTFVPGNLEQGMALSALLEGAAAVVHCAGLIKAPSRAAFFATNATATAELAARAAAAGPVPFVYVSSLAARAPQLSAYAASKRAGEEAARCAYGDGPLAVLRPPAIYGPGDRATLALFRQARAGLCFVPAPASARLSLIHVEDAAAAIGALLSAPGSGPLAPGQVFELDDGCDGGYSWPRIAQAAGDAVGRRVYCVPLPGRLVEAAAALNVLRCRLGGGVPLLTPEKLREIRHPDWVCRDDALMRITGWRPRIGLDEGFRHSVAWYRTAGWL